MNLQFTKLVTERGNKRNLGTCKKIIFLQCLQDREKAYARNWNEVKERKRSKIYTTHVCSLLWSVENLERIDKKPELSANTVNFYFYR